MPDLKKRAKRRGGISATFWVLGIIVATLSLVSLVQHWSDVGLHGVAERVIDYYRAVMRAAKEALFDWWAVQLWPGFKIPEIAVDVLAIWALAGLSVVRGSVTYDSVRGETSLDSRSEILTAVVVVLFGPVAFVLFVAAIGVVMWDVFRERALKVQTGTYRGILRDVSALAFGLLAPFIGAALFFTWSALQL